MGHEFAWELRSSQGERGNMASCAISGIPAFVFQECLLHTYYVSDTGTNAEDTEVSKRKMSASPI